MEEGKGVYETFWEEVARTRLRSGVLLVCEVIS